MYSASNLLARVNKSGGRRVGGCRAIQRMLDGDMLWNSDKVELPPRQEHTGRKIVPAIFLDGPPECFS